MENFTLDRISATTVHDTRGFREDEEYPVRYRITFNGKQTYYPSGIKMTKEDWAKMQLESIVPQAEEAGAAPGRLSEPVFWLTTRTWGGSRIRWGYAPGAGAAGELPAAEKVARLKRYFADHDTFDGPQNTRQELDVRTMPSGRE